MRTALKTTIIVVACTAGLLFYLLDRSRKKEKPISISEIEVLQYSDVVGYFVDNRPPGASKGALLREIKDGRFLYSWMYLDSEGEILKDSEGTMIGQQAFVKNIDDELSHLFQEKDLIIFE
jgi:hypothetical protein